MTYLDNLGSRNDLLTQLRVFANTNFYGSWCNNIECWGTRVQVSPVNVFEDPPLKFSTEQLCVPTMPL